MTMPSQPIVNAVIHAETEEKLDRLMTVARAEAAKETLMRAARMLRLAGHRQAAALLLEDETWAAITERVAFPSQPPRG